MNKANPPIHTAKKNGRASMPQVLHLAMPDGKLRRDQLLHMGTGGLLGMASPRLPLPPLLCLDEVTELNTEGGAFGLGGASGSMALHGMEWAFDCHFDGDPVLPGSLMIEALLQLVGISAAMRGYAGKARVLALRDVRFIREVRNGPGFLDYRVDICRVSDQRQILYASGKATVSGRSCATVGEAVLIIRQPERNKRVPR